MNQTQRRDALPLWVIVLLLVFLALRILSVVLLPHARAVKEGVTVNDAAMQDLVETDLEAKSAYAYGLRRYPSDMMDISNLNRALKSAQSFESDTYNSPDAARHVILLRALIELAAPVKKGAKALAPLAVGANHLAPLAAYTTALPSDTPATDRVALAAEGALWQRLFSAKTITATQAAQFAAQIRALPEIRWWRWPALSILYHLQGDAALSRRYGAQARSHALAPLVGLSLLTLLRLGLGLLGVLILLYFAFRLALRRQRAGKPILIPDLWPTLPERQPYSERCLGAGDLMAVFVVYLIARKVIVFVLSGFGGFGAGHLFAVTGAITPFLAEIRRMPAQQRDTLEVILDAVTYLLAAVPPIGYLFIMARQRGASLRRELGWSANNLGPNTLYGIAGYAIATPLMLLASFLAPHLFHHAPAPSNPVIPEMASASGFWTTALLIILASVVAPLVEELLFRGVFYNAAKLRLGVWPAIILTGFVFGFLHPVGVAEMLEIAVLGGVFAWMAETRKSLVPSIAAHCLNNLSSTLILLLALAR